MIDPRKLQRGIRLLVFGAVAVLAGLFLRRSERYEIPVGDPSLAPYYPGGTIVMVDELDGDDTLETGWDVVYAMEREGQLYARFGRVRALPGDAVGEREGELTVNGQGLKPRIRVDRVMGKVPAGTVLILPVIDQVSNYPDSRELGFIPRAHVHARIVARVN